MAKATEKAVTKATDAQVPAHLQGMQAYDEDFTREDFSYGWLRITQDMTENKSSGSEKYIKGLESGDFFNSMTNEKYESPLKVVMLKFFRSYREVTDEQRPKFVRSIDPDEWNELNLIRKGSRYHGFPSGNIGQESFNYMVFLPEHPDDGILRMSISPGGFGAAKAWNSLTQAKKIAKHFQIWNLKPVYNKNDQGQFYTIGTGNSFSGEFVGFVDEKLAYQMADAVNLLNSNTIASQLQHGISDEDDTAPSSGKGTEF